MVSNIACEKQSGTDNPSILKFLELLILIVYLLQMLHLSSLTIFFPLAITVSHSSCSHVTVFEFLIKIVLPLLKRIKLNVLWLSSVFCSIIIIFIPIFAVFSLSQMLSTYHRIFLFLIGYHCFLYRKQPIAAHYFELWMQLQKIFLQILYTNRSCVCMDNAY